MMKERQIMWRVGLVVSILAASLVLAEVFSKQVEHPAFSQMQDAADRMTRAEAAIAARRVALGIAIDPNLDPYRTGLIGAESSFLTTTVGDIVAKRTTTTTAFAALVVRYFYEL
ncbi:MAG: poly-gamma-glutamate system protein, partial [Spirochaetia bacterium]|nr:poly-gamma-glutamate system protein [Spirochaetia bacterium]